MKKILLSVLILLGVPLVLSAIGPDASALSSFCGAPPSQHFVIGVASDDPDGGLVVRSGPGSEHGAIGVLRPRQTGIYPTGRCVISNAGSAWYEINREQGALGWVSSNYLRPAEPACLQRATRNIHTNTITQPGSVFAVRVDSATAFVPIGQIGADYELVQRSVITRGNFCGQQGPHFPLACNPGPCGPPTYIPPSPPYLPPCTNGSASPLPCFPPPPSFPPCLPGSYSTTSPFPCSTPPPLFPPCVTAPYAPAWIPSCVPQLACDPGPCLAPGVSPIGIHSFVCVSGLVGSDGLNVRTGPGTNHAIKTALAADTCVERAVGQRVNGWVPIVIPTSAPGATSTQGWVFGKYVAELATG